MYNKKCIERIKVYQRQSFDKIETLKTIQQNQKDKTGIAVNNLWNKIQQVENDAAVQGNGGMIQNVVKVTYHKKRTNYCC